METVRKEGGKEEKELTFFLASTMLRIFHTLILFNPHNNHISFLGLQSTKYHKLGALEQQKLIVPILEYKTKVSVL